VLLNSEEVFPNWFLALLGAKDLARGIRREKNVFRRKERESG